MEELRKILIDAINALKKKDNYKSYYIGLDKVYNKALEDVINLVIKKIPD